MTEVAASKNPFAEILRRIAELRPPPVVSTGQKAASVTLSTQNCRAMCAMTVPDWAEFPTRRRFLISASGSRRYETGYLPEMFVKPDMLAVVEGGIRRMSAEIKPSKARWRCPSLPPRPKEAC